ncbi:hypothetical protein PFICI_02250 [Pestalotiopsis fici W106-1]|uniref:Xylanolytic transcriptional activator regulatory domain-containing protein n=1 Tax=Pestalotiopsis fici (strain W106-1 / CGMCC3.15140) TaxID=1229662 RepID=W3XDW5_PESFW|nr:uncharacterized protein PFICI_02250 [Pestalotiopsis fici W106-1]ETS84225.1 hypothetical protein PFICI_02250 [Pestalotiopsis fici W106-1]
MHARGTSHWRVDAAAIENKSAPRGARARTALSPDPPSYVQRLEERVAQLESLIPQERLDHIDAALQQDQDMSDSRPEIQPSINNPAQSFRAPSQFSSPLQNDVDIVGPWAQTPSENGGPTDIFGTLSGIYSPPLQTSSEEAARELPELDTAAEQSLIQIYFDMAQSQYPFLLKHEVINWAESWRTEKDTSSLVSKWKGFFVYMVYSIALLMTKTRVDGTTKSSQAFYTHATSKYLPYLVKSPNLVLRAQGFLLLTVYAMHMPVQDSIIALSSWTIRFCIMAQLHLVETEPLGSDRDSSLHVQHRRRIFWCSYAIDRAVCSSYDFPFSIPDHHITVPFYGNINDDQLLPAIGHAQLTESLLPTSVSSALHVLASRRLESEIQETLLSKDFAMSSSQAFAWRTQMMQKLQAWNRQSEALSEPSRKGYVGQGWLKMIYYYGVVTLWRPDRTIAKGSAGDLSVRACCQALLLFRKFQMAREIAHPWLGLLTQFQIGVTLLYCFYATPISHWKASYKCADVSSAIRACSSTLAILAERWIEAECVRDMFEILASEIPIGQSWDRPAVMGDAGRAAIEENWERVAKIVIHRPTLRMIREMATEDFVVDGPEETGVEIRASTATNQNTAEEATNLMPGIGLQWHDSSTPSLDFYGNMDTVANLEALSPHTYFDM